MAGISSEKERHSLPNDSTSAGGVAGGDFYTDYLIVGTGPAGASLACFMASHGLQGLMVSQDPSNADTPRAHVTHPPGLDCLRDIGLDEDCYQLGSGSETLEHTRWCLGMAGKELARIYSWGNGPHRKGDYSIASPSHTIDIPQTLLEPILTRYATLNGFQLRWSTRFVSFADDPINDRVTTTLLDTVSGLEYHVTSKFLFGADGARSQVMRQLQIPFVSQPSPGFAVNVLLEADLSHLVKSRMGNLHWIFTPDRELCDFAPIGCLRMVKPWHEWLCIVFPLPGLERAMRTEEEYLARVREFIGDDTIPVKILGLSSWAINESVAKEYRRGNVFCIGDSCHRHPPNHGLGSNTCIQDAFNLAWKVAYVAKGIAGKELLDTYNIERQPVGRDIVTQANNGLRMHRNIWNILGVIEPTAKERVAALTEFSADSDAGRERREALKTALEDLDTEEHNLGIQMNQRYTSAGVYLSDQGEAPVFTSDPLRYYHRSTYPGFRLPHVWLNHAVPTKPVSTLDVAGKGRFTLLIGHGGDGWRAAVEKLSQDGIPIAAISIGFGLDYEDVYMDWARMRGVADSGCVLVRPDCFVAWRCQSWNEHAGTRLAEVLQTILFRKGLKLTRHVQAVSEQNLIK